MIVVFVIDTSPSMGELVSGSVLPTTTSMSRLDLAKMTVESLTGMLERRVHEHNHKVQMETLTWASSSSNTNNSISKSHQNTRFGFSEPDQFLLLSTGRQYTSRPASAACGAGGRFLVGFRHDDVVGGNLNSSDHQQPKNAQINVQQNNSFERELKRLKPTIWKQQKGKPRVPFPEDGGGAVGLNAALSAGLQLLSRYRLKHRCTENFGMGRLPSTAILVPSSGPGGSSNSSGTGSFHQATNALQPACLILLTDGECLRRPQTEGGGPLQLQFGNLPLREFYSEPFRWDQRIFCLGVGSSSDKLHSSLRAFSEVTGGCHLPLRSVSDISQASGILLRLIAPAIPSQLPILNPLRLRSLPPVTVSKQESNHGSNCMAGGTYVNGGPICTFQDFDGITTHRAMLLYTPYHMDMMKIIPNNYVHNAPIWCIPESFFPSKKLDSLPPRKAQPILHYTRNHNVLGAVTFDPLLIMKSLHRLDQLTISSRQIFNSQMMCGKETPLKVLQRDVYICEWCQEAPHSQFGQEHFAVCVRGSGRVSLSDGDESFLNIGILHVPTGLSNTTKISTLTILPPDPHILLPLLLKAAEIEHRVLKKMSEKKMSEKKEATNSYLLAASRSVHLDENWRSDFRAYLFRIPPYYQHILRRSLRHILPSSTHSLFNTDTIDSVISQCFSRLCLQKIRNAELFSKESNERLERHEEEFRKHTAEHDHEDGLAIGYGKYDNRTDPSNYLAALRNMPPPWRVGAGTRFRKTVNNSFGTGDGVVNRSSKFGDTIPATERIGNLPNHCLLAYYESRRRWIFGGSGLTIRGLAVEGVNNDGTNSHYYDANHGLMDESLLSVAGVGASGLNKTDVSKMGDFKERLLFSRKPIVGYGCNDSTGSAATTAPDGSPLWSVDDDALPLNFFNLKTGEFSDSVLTRVRARLSINFGNPYRDKRGSTLIPEKNMNQRPPLHQNIGTPPDSPPHAFSSYEGEGEALFGGRISPSTSNRHESDESINNHERKRKIEHTAQSCNKVKKGKVASSTVSGLKIKDASTSERIIGGNTQTILKQLTKKKKPKPPSPPQRRLLKGKTVSVKLNEHAKQSLPPPPSRPPPPPPGRSSTISKLSLKHRPPPPPHSLSSSKQRVPPHQLNIQPPLKKKPPPPPKPTQISQVKARTHKLLPCDVQSINVKPKVNLPPGWISVWSKSQRRWYYFNQNTNKSVWEWPPPGN